MSDLDRFLDDLRPFEEQLTGRPDFDFLRLTSQAGSSLGALLRRQTDETLAAAVQAGVCRNAVIQELLHVRYSARLADWFRLDCRAAAHAVDDLVSEVY